MVYNSKFISVDYDVIAFIKENLRNLPERQRVAGQKAMLQCAEDLLEKSKDLVPVDTGALKENGHIERLSDGSGYAVVYDITAGERNPRATDKDFKYGALQHEELSFHHDIGQALYLEIPYESNKDDYKAKIANAIRRATGNVRGRAMKKAKRGRR